MKTDNQLIAEFLGFRFKEGIVQNEVFYTLKKEHPIYLEGYSYRLAKFDKSWDWLMPVVEKIENLEGYRFDITIRQNTITIFDCLTQKELFFLTGDSKIEVIYSTIVEFIKLYTKYKE